METQTTSTTFMDDLLGFLNNEEEEVLGVSTEEGFKIDSTEQANYFARKLREVREQKAEAEAAAEQQLEAYQERVDKWLASTLSPLAYEEERILSLLQSFATDKLEGSTKKSLKLIEGTLQFRKQAPKYEYEDKTLLAFVESKLPELAKEKVTVSVDKAELKKKLSVKDGKAYIGEEEVKGITVTELPDAFDVK